MTYCIYEMIWLILRSEGVVYTSDSTLVCSYMPGWVPYILTKPTELLGSAQVIHKGRQDSLPKKEIDCVY